MPLKATGQAGRCTIGYLLGPTRRAAGALPAQEIAKVLAGACLWILVAKNRAVEVIGLRAAMARTTDD
jgi:hypothetical protein